MAIITPSQARETAHNLGLKMIAADEENSQQIKELVDEINSAPLKDMNMEEIGALLSLPDNQFALIAPAFLEEIEKTYNNINTRISDLCRMQLAVFRL